MENKKLKVEQMYKLAEKYFKELSSDRLFNDYCKWHDELVYDNINNNIRYMSEKELSQIPSYCGLPYIGIFDEIAGYRMLTVLCVSLYVDDIEYNLIKLINEDHTFIANAYVINLDEPTFSEAGSVTIAVDRQNQTLRRIY